MLSRAELVSQAQLGDTVKSAFNNDGMTSDDTWRRIRALRKHADMSGEMFGAEFGVTKAAVSQWESENPAKRTQPELETLRLMARRFDVSLDWLADARGIPPAWIHPHHSSGGTDPGVSLAQELIHPMPMIEPITIVWESIPVANLPNLFKVALPDDAMAPEYRQGTVVAFSTAEGAPRADDAVLLTDADGNWFFRLYKPRRPGHWQAVAVNAAYEPMDSKADGLTVVAIAMAKWGRRG